MIKRIVCLVFTMVMMLLFFGCTTDEEQYGKYSGFTKNDDITYTDNSTETTDKNTYNSILTTENKNNVSTDIITNTNTAPTTIPTTTTNSITNVTSNTTDSMTVSSTTTIATDATEGEISSSTTDDIENTITSNIISESNNATMTTTKEPSNSDITEDTGTPVDKIVYNIGDKVHLGEYYRDTQGRYKGAIEWIVIDEKDGNYLLLSDYVLDCIVFDPDGNNDFTKSYLNNWLNSDFYNCFSNVEKKKILHAEYDCSGKKFFAYVTIPSASEYIKYNLLDSKYTFYAKSQGLSTYNNICCWWLRSTDFSNYDKEGRADWVHYNGYNNTCSFCTRSEGIKPMLWYNPNGGQ